MARSPRLILCIALALQGAVAQDDTAPPSPPDIVFIVPDRSTPYPNGLHNGIVTSSYNQPYSVEIREYGNYDQGRSLALLQEAIDAPEEMQPRIYCIWPMDVESKELVKELYEAHGSAVVQINQLPEEWELDHLVGYAGPDDAERAGNAGVMMVDAMRARNVDEAKIVALGYPASYGGYPLSIHAFRKAISTNEDESMPITIVKEVPLARPDLRQSAYNEIIRLVETNVDFNGIYAMDDDILLGAYEALNDRGLVHVAGENGDDDDAVTLVGTVCNGARELLENGKQHGTTIQAPMLEAILAFDQAIEYLETGRINETIRFTPNPIATGDTWDGMVVEFLGGAYAADSLCTWNQYHERKNGLLDVNDAQDACEWVDCVYVPEGLYVAGYVMVAVNYVLIVACAILLWIHRKKKIILLAQPLFLALILFGAGVDTTSIIFMSRDGRDYTKEQLDRGCVAYPCLLGLGSMLTTSTLVAKLYRVKKVTGNMRPGSNFTRTVKVTPRDVMGFIIGGLVLVSVILGAWYGLDPFRWQIRVITSDFNDLILQAVGQCSSDGDYAWIYPALVVVLIFCFLVYANVIAFQTRMFHQISDSKMAAVSVFNSIQLLILATIMVSMSGNNVSVAYIIKACYAFLNNFGVVALMLCPKLYQCHKNQGNAVRLNFERAGAPQADPENRHISGLGDVSHIDVRRLSADDSGEANANARRRLPDESLNTTPRGDPENRHISGLGDVGHIDVRRLSVDDSWAENANARRRLPDESLNTTGSLNTTDLLHATERPSVPEMVISAQSLAVGEIPAEEQNCSSDGDKEGY